MNKKVVGGIHLEKMQKPASRPGIIQGRLEEMTMTDLLQSLEMGQKSCRLVVRRGGERGQLYFTSGQCPDPTMGPFQAAEPPYHLLLSPERPFAYTSPRSP